MFTTLSAEDLALDVGFSERSSWRATPVTTPSTCRCRSSSAGIRRGCPRRSRPPGLRPGGWWLPVEWREARETYDAEMEKARTASALAQAVGARWCNTWIWPFSDVLDYRSNFELHVERLKPVAALLGEHGCVLGIEFVGPKTMRDDHLTSSSPRCTRRSS